MKRRIPIFAMFLAVFLASCGSKEDKTLLSRDFPTMSWERFDFIKKEIIIEEPTTYNLVLTVSFDPSYDYDYFSVVFTVFDDQDNPSRTKNYKFKIKENDGTWKSTLTEDAYVFSFPINNELTVNEPGTYVFQLENRMPITPLLGIKKIAIVQQ